MSRPLPTPTATETEGMFMTRCQMERVMLDDFPDRDERINQCQIQWDDAKPGAENVTRGMQSNTLSFKFQIKALGESEFEGYGSVFGNVDLGGDIVLPGAFAATLKEHKSQDQLPQMFYGHDPMLVPGKWTEMKEDSTGLYVKGKLLMGTQLGRETREQLKEKAIRGLSIGYGIRNRKDDIAYDDDGNRLLKKVDLFEVSLVSMPMNTEATVNSAKELKRRMETELRREVNFGSAKAKQAVSVGFRIFAPYLKFTDQPGIRDVAQPRDGEYVDETAEALRSIDALTDAMRASIFR